MNILTAGALLLLVAVPAPAQKPPPSTLPAQIIVIRHAEKPVEDNDPHLSPAGTKRANALVSYVTTDPRMTRFGKPVAVFATHTTKDLNGQRTQETVAPLAKALALPVLTPSLGKNYAELAASVLSNPAYAGKTVLICWNHENIPQLVAALGVSPEPPKWKGKVFDLVYVITFNKGHAKFATAHYGAE